VCKVELKNLCRSGVYGDSEKWSGGKSERVWKGQEECERERGVRVLGVRRKKRRERNKGEKV